jgi:pimeloyl-ACP methyl ester carboxylesterase
MERMIHVAHREKEWNVSCDVEHVGNRAAVFLHGFQSQKQAFLPCKELCKRNGLSFVAIDFVGFGDSDKPEDFSYDLADQADIVSNALNQLGFENFFLIGHSLGGMVGTMLLERYREHLLGFINMEGNFVLADCGASLPASQMTFEEFSREGYPELKTSLETSGEPSAQLRRVWLESTPDYVFYQMSRSIVSWSKSEKLLEPFIKSPVKKLFVYGEKNRQKKNVLPAFIATAEIPRAGHFMLSDNLEYALRVIEEFCVSS